MTEIDSNVREKKIGKAFLTFLGLPILGVILTIASQQLFFKKNKAFKEDIKFSYEYLKTNFALLNKVKEFSEISSKKENKRTTMSYLDRDNREYAHDSIGFEVTLPTIAVDGKLRNEWERLYEDLMKEKLQLDNSLLKAIVELHQFVDKNPFPEGDSYDLVENSGWNDVEILGRWNTLNSILEMKVDRRLQPFKEDVTW